MKETFYKVVNNPIIGLCIKESKSVIELWVDQYEGGEAYLTDWTFEETFKTNDDVKTFILTKWGDVELFNPED